MKFHYGIRSTAAIESCHEKLKAVAYLALTISPVDIIVVSGLRNREAQERAFSLGTSKKHWPDSNHNGVSPNFDVSYALDFAPWINSTINWNDSGSFYMLAGVWMAAARMEDVRVRYGGDWDSDGLTKDQTFQDLGHIELLGYV